MLPRGYVNIDKDYNSVAMFEMFQIAFIRRELATDVSKVKQVALEKGWMNIVGNKGGVAYSFQLKNRLFNFIAVHLRHGQSKEAERDQMAQQLVSQMKMQELQTHIPGLESDAIADFCFFFGDLNYRLNTNYASLNNTNIQNAIPMIPKFD